MQQFLEKNSKGRTEITNLSENNNIHQTNPKEKVVGTGQIPSQLAS